MRPPDLQKQLDDVQEELHTVRAQIYSALKGQHAAAASGAGSFDCSGEAERRFDLLKREVGALMADLDAAPGVTALLTETAGQSGSLQAQVKACETALAALTSVCNAAQLLESVDSAVSGGRCVAFVTYANIYARVLLGHAVKVSLVGQSHNLRLLSRNAIAKCDNLLLL
jgi:hypothetical protein